MRQHKILTRTLLLLSIINFTLAAPVVARGRPEVRLDGNVPRNVTAVSQERKRRDGTSESPSPTNLNVPGPVHAHPPREEDSADPLTDILSQMAYADSPPPSPDTPQSPVADSPSPPPPSPHHSQPGPSAPPPDPLTDILSQPAHADSPTPTPDTSSTSSPGSLTGSDSVSPSPGLPVSGSLSPPLSPSPHPGQPGPSENRFPGPSSSSVNADKLSKHWDKVLGESRLLGLMLAARPPPPPLPHSSQPGPSEDRFPDLPGFSMNPGKLSATGSTGVNSKPASEFWDNVLKESQLLESKLAPGSHLPPPPPLHHPAEAGLPTGSPSPDESMPKAGSLSPPPPPSPHSSPPSSEDRFPSPSGSSVNRPTDSQPTPPQDPGVDSETPSRLSPEPIPADFWDGVLKGKLKRGDSGSDSVNFAQKDTRSRIF